MQGDVLGVVVQEIDGVELLLEFFFDIGVQIYVVYDFVCFFLVLFLGVVDWCDFVVQQVECGVIEVFQQFVFLVILDFGVGVVNVGDGQQVECGEGVFIVDGIGKGVDYFGVVQVLFLCYGGYGQVMFDQEDDEFCIFF